jgi:hypothetical protein
MQGIKVKTDPPARISLHRKPMLKGFFTEDPSATWP